MRYYDTPLISSTRHEAGGGRCGGGGGETGLGLVGGSYRSSVCAHESAAAHLYGGLVESPDPPADTYTHMRTLTRAPWGL